MRTHELLATSKTVHVGFYDASLKAVLEIESGDVVELVSLSAGSGDDVPAEWIPKPIPEIETSAKRGPGPHILTGPISVATAQPGDLLQIDFLEIELIQPYGYNRVAPLKGMFKFEQPTARTTIIPIDLEARQAQVLADLWLPCRPFFGSVGVAPPADWGRIDSRPPGIHGGNIDNKELVAGTRLFLPVWVDGALLSLGDGHAAQGDGEVNQTAIETSLRGRISATVRKDLPSVGPFAVTAEYIVTMGFHEDLDDAAQTAMRQMIRLLKDEFNYSFHEAYRLCSVAADLRVTQVVNGERGAHAVLSHSLLRKANAWEAFRDKFMNGHPVGL